MNHHPPHPASDGDPPAPAEFSTALIREWHTMTAAQQHTEWAALVAWVIWIHDLYELAKEERLPLCWPNHPGLVEELRTLKAWREAIYDNPDAAASPHTARSWHGELRQTIAAATTFWAPTCRAGHTDSPPLHHAHPHLADQWRATGPPTVASAPGGIPTLPATMTHQQMAAALAAGHAQPHSRGINHHVKHAGAWWTRTPGGEAWQRCTDPAQHTHLEQTSTRLRAADAAHDQLHRP